jgi:cytochrome c-type biogenesis protein CcmH
MITFWIVCGVFLVIALAYVLPPLLQTDNEGVKDEGAFAEANISVYKDQLAELESDLQHGIIAKEQYEQEREEIQRRVLEDVSGKDLQPASVVSQTDKRAAYVMAIALPALSLAIYSQIGNTNARTAQPVATPASASDVSPPMSPAQIEANVASLAKRLEQNPSDLRGWTMLARSYGILQKYNESSKAYEKAVALSPRDAELISNYAFTLAMANGGKFQGRPQELIKQALEIDSANISALGLAGGAAFEQKDYKQAVAHWTRLLANVPSESEMAQTVRQKLEEAKTLASSK